MAARRRRNYKDGRSNEDVVATKTNINPVKPAWETFLLMRDDALTKHKNLLADREKVIAAMGELAILSVTDAEVSSAAFAKLDEAEKSIRTKKIMRLWQFTIKSEASFRKNTGYHLKIFFD